MPSGAKKRRIAKKKKGLQASLSSSNSSVQSQGSDYVQHFADKESDGGSPVSQEHPNTEHSFAEGGDKDVEETVENLSGQLAVSEQSFQEAGFGSGENVTPEEGGIVQIEWELKSEEDYGSKEGSIESKEVHTGGSSGSSGSSSRRSSNSSISSSDDDSHVKKEVVEAGHAVDTLFEAAKQVDTSILAGENSNVVSETASVVTADKGSLTKDVVQINESSFPNYSVTPAGDILEVQEVGYKLEVKESADKISPDNENSTGNSSILMDLGLREVEDKAVSTSEEKPAFPVEANNSATEGKEVKLLLTFDAPTVHASKDADHIKASDSPEFFESKPLVASAPQATQKTSLKSCCGIFELFTSSDR